MNIKEFKSGKFTAKIKKIGSQTLMITNDESSLESNNDVLFVVDATSESLNHFIQLAHSFDGEYKTITCEINDQELLEKSVDTIYSCDMLINKSECIKYTNALSTSPLFNKELLKQSLRLPFSRSTDFLSMLAVDQVPFKATRDELIALISTALDFSADEIATSIDSAKREFNNSVATFDGFSVTTAVDQYRDIESVKSAVEALHAVHLVKAGKASGKTKHVAKPAIQAALDAGKKVCVISPRRAITRSSYGSIEGLTHYEEKKLGDDAGSINIVVNSIINKKFEDDVNCIDLLVVDEIQQVLNHIFNGTVKNAKKVFDTLRAMIKRAENVILLDADMNQTAVKFVESTGRRDIFVHNVNIEKSDIKVELAKADDVATLIDIAVRKNETVFVATDIKNTADALAEKLKSEYPGKNIVCVTSNTIDLPEIKTLMANINVEIKNVDILIFSPAISAAVSIEVPHFTAHFGLFYGNTGPALNLQQLFRDRTAKGYTVGLKNTQTLDFSGIQKDTSDTSSYAEIGFHLDVEKQFMKNHFEAAFLQFCIRQGHTVSYSTFADEVAKVGRKIIKSGKKIVEDQYVENMLTIEAATDIEKAIADKKAGEFTPELAIKIEKAQMMSEMVLDNVNLDDIKLWAHGAIVKHIEALELVKMDPIQRSTLINADEKLPARDRKLIQLKHTFFTLIVETLNLDLELNTTRYGVDEAKALLKALYDQRKLWNRLHIKPATRDWKDSANALMIVNKILFDIFGIKTDATQITIQTEIGKKRVRKFAFNTERFDAINEILARRESLRIGSDIQEYINTFECA